MAFKTKRYRIITYWRDKCYKWWAVDARNETAPSHEWYNDLMDRLYEFMLDEYRILRHRDTTIDDKLSIARLKKGMLYRRIVREARR